MSLQSIFEKLALLEVETIGGVSTDRICEAESAIGLKLPNSYRQYLLRFGASIFENSYELFGLPDTSKYDDEPPLFSNLIEEVEHYKELEGFEGLVHILHNGCSDVYFLDTLNGDEDDCPVVLCNPSVGCVRYTDTFEEFLSIYLAKGIDKHATSVENSLG